MQIEVYHMTAEEDALTITLEAVCDTFSSLLWDIEYYKCGSFEVYIAANPENLSIFQTGRIVGRDDDSQHFGIIESVQIDTDAENGDYLTVKGRFLMCLLERRIINPTLSITADTAYSDIVRNAVTLNAIQNDNRCVPSLSLGTVSGSCWEQTATLQVSYANLMEWMYTICDKIGGTANIRLIKDVGETYKMVLDLSEGTDRSLTKDTEPHIIFSDAYSNLLSFSYASDSAITRNFAYIYGHGEDSECKHTTYCVGDEPTYLDRYELYVDAKDISEEEQVEGETVPIPEDKYIELLKTRGSEKLVDPKTTSESEIAADSTQYVYNRDYYVGDYVTVKHKRFGMIQPKVQLIGMIEAFDQNGRSLTPGTPAENPTLPSLPTDENKTRLLMYAVRLDPGATELSDRDWYDYREDANVCGYCKCILGKCKVTELMSQMAQLIVEVQENNQTIEELINKVDELTAEVEYIGDVILAGQCGDNVYYVLYSNGKVLLKGTGPMYEYDSSDRFPFYRNDAVKKVVVSEGITSVGYDAFLRCMNLESASLPSTLTYIGSGAFMSADEYQSAAGKLKNLTIPDAVTTIGGGAFWGAALLSLTIPHNVSSVGSYVCRDCTRLVSVRYEGSVIGAYMFVSCTSLSEFTVANTVTEIKEHCFNYCTSLQTITYEGSLAQWQAIPKGTSWDGKGGSGLAVSGLTRIQCLDGFMEWDAENHEWKVGEE